LTTIDTGFSDCALHRCGHSLSPGGPGKTDSPADFSSLPDDLEERVFGQLPDDTWVYPGHGDDTTLGGERPSIPEWRAHGLPRAPVPK
jgi:glyoxylase-like metal-dependent hydrolase (beta-lactamase superfamily II)